MPRMSTMLPMTSTLSPGLPGAPPAQLPVSCRQLPLPARACTRSTHETGLQQCSWRPVSAPGSVEVGTAAAVPTTGHDGALGWEWAAVAGDPSSPSLCLHTGHALCCRAKREGMAQTSERSNPQPQAGTHHAAPGTMPCMRAGCRRRARPHTPGARQHAELAARPCAVQSVPVVRALTSLPAPSLR